MRACAPECGVSRRSRRTCPLAPRGKPHETCPLAAVSGAAQCSGAVRSFLPVALSCAMWACVTLTCCATRVRQVDDNVDVPRSRARILQRPGVRVTPAPGPSDLLRALRCRASHPSCTRWQAGVPWLRWWIRWIHQLCSWADAVHVSRCPVGRRLRPAGPPGLRRPAAPPGLRRLRGRGDVLDGWLYNPPPESHPCPSFLHA